MSARAALAALVVLVGAPLVRADEPVRAEERPIDLDAPASCTTADGRSATLPPGVLVPAPAWARLDAEVRRLQEVETRITAENASLRASAGEVELRHLLAAAGVGVVVGVVVALLLPQRERVAPAP